MIEVYLVAYIKSQARLSSDGSLPAEHQDPVSFHLIALPPLTCGPQGCNPTCLMRAEEKEHGEMDMKDLL